MRDKRSLMMLAERLEVRLLAVKRLVSSSDRGEGDGDSECLDPRLVLAFGLTVSDEVLPKEVTES